MARTKVAPARQLEFSEAEIPTVDLVAVLAKALEEQRKSWDKDGKIYATDLGYALGPEHSGCQRQFWEKCRNAPRREPSVGELLMFRMGELVEEEVVRLLTAALPSYGWEVVETQTRVQNHGVSGRLDIKIRHIETGLVRIVDVKTKRGGAFGYLNAPKPDNVLQVQFYAEGQDAVAGDLLYVDREGSNFAKQFEVQRNDKRPKKAAEILTQIRDCDEPPPPLLPRLVRKENKGPDSLYIKLPWQVEWCDLKRCPCREACGKVPEGIVAKVDNKGKVTMTEGNEKQAETVMRLLREAYPDEDFFLEEGGDV